MQFIIKCVFVVKKQLISNITKYTVFMLLMKLKLRQFLLKLLES